jgi:hypothetical protein
MIFLDWRKYVYGRHLIFMMIDHLKKELGLPADGTKPVDHEKAKTESAEEET